MEEAETQRTEQEDLDDSNLLFEIICEGLTVDATDSSLAEKSLTAWLVSINPGNRYITTTFYNSIWETLESQLDFDLTHEAQLLSSHNEELRSRLESEIGQLGDVTFDKQLRQPHFRYVQGAENTIEEDISLGHALFNLRSSLSQITDILPPLSQLPDFLPTSDSSTLFRRDLEPLTFEDVIVRNCEYDEPSVIPTVVPSSAVPTHRFLTDSFITYHDSYDSSGWILLPSPRLELPRRSVIEGRIRKRRAQKKNLLAQL